MPSRGKWVDVNILSLDDCVSSIMSGKTVKLHTLPILNISDHYTRTSVDIADDSLNLNLQDPLCLDKTILCGALLSTADHAQTIIHDLERPTDESSLAGSVEISNSIELCCTQISKNAIAVWDESFLHERFEQCQYDHVSYSPDLKPRAIDKQVLPGLKIVGWYIVQKEHQTVTKELQSMHDTFLRATARYHELDEPNVPGIETNSDRREASPCYLLIFSPCADSQSETLPIALYASDSSNDGENAGEASGPTALHSMPFTVEMSQTERIVIDDTLKAEVKSSSDDARAAAMGTCLLRRICNAEQNVTNS